MTAILSSGGHELWGILLIKISQDKFMYRKSHPRFLCDVTTKFCHKFGNASNVDEIDDLISMCKFRQSLSWLNVGATNMIEIT